MRKRYDLRRSDNYPYMSKVSYICSGSGTLRVVTGFPVTKATVSFATLPVPTIYNEVSSSSESVGNVSTSSSSSSSESIGSYSTSSSSSSSGSEISTSLSEEPGFNLPRIFVSSYTSDGFVVTYENIPESVGYIEFSYVAV